MELSGSLDISTAASLQARLREALAAGRYEVRAARVTRADTAALQLLTAFAREVRQKGQQVRWLEPSEPLREAARLLGVSRELGL